MPEDGCMKGFSVPGWMGERRSAAAWREGSKGPYPGSAGPHQPVGTSRKHTCKILTSVGEAGWAPWVTGNISGSF